MTDNALANLDAEQQVLGAILMNNDALDRAAPFIGPEDFSEGLHRLIFRHIEKMVGQGRVASALTLEPYLAEDFKRAEISVDYLVNLSAAAGPMSLVPDYARVIRALSVRRKVTEAAQDAMESAGSLDINEAPEALVEQLQARLDTILSRDTRKGAVSIGAAAQESVRIAELAFKNPGIVTGIPTGLTKLDKALSGLHGGRLYVFAGASKMGKTSLAMNVAVNVCTNANDPKRGLVFSMEMDAGELADRALSSKTGIPARDVKAGSINEAEYRKWREAGEWFASVPLDIDDTGGLTISELQTRARRHRRTKGLDLVVVDYLQLMEGEGIRGEGRVGELTKITRGLKLLAKDLDIPVIALSQLNREVNKRVGRRPMLSDLRESGSIEQDADAVIFVHRENYYLRQDGPPANADDRANYYTQLNKSDGRADLIIAAQRHGPTGQVTVAFKDETTTFSDLGVEA